MSYWAGVDSVAHRKGPADPAVAAQLRLQDAALRHLLAGIDAMDRWHTLTLLVVSDHGMTVAGELIDAAAALADAGVKARVLGSAVANVYLEDAQDLEAATAALAGLNKVRVRQRADIPATWRLRHDGRTGDLVATTVPPFVLSPPSNPLCALMPSRCLSPGGHGYRPDHPATWAASCSPLAVASKRALGSRPPTRLISPPPLPACSAWPRPPNRKGRPLQASAADPVAPRRWPTIQPASVAHSRACLGAQMERPK